jgi:hypothetical protein
LRREPNELGVLIAREIESPSALHLETPRNSERGEDALLVDDRTKDVERPKATKLHPCTHSLPGRLFTKRATAFRPPFGIRQNKDQALFSFAKYRGGVATSKPASNRLDIGQRATGGPAK